MLIFSLLCFLFFQRATYDAENFERISRLADLALRKEEQVRIIITNSTTASIILNTWASCRTTKDIIPICSSKFIYNVTFTIVYSSINKPISEDNGPQISVVAKNFIEGDLHIVTCNNFVLHFCSWLRTVYFTHVSVPKLC